MAIEVARSTESRGPDVEEGGGIHGNCTTVARAANRIDPRGSIWLEQHGAILVEPWKVHWVDWLHVQLRAEIGQHISLINQGRGGDTAQDLLGRVHRDVLSFQPSLVIVTVGGNDAMNDSNTEEFPTRLRTLCEILGKHGAIPVLQTYYCPMFHAGPQGFKERFEANMQVIRDLAKELGTPLVDQYPRFEPFYRKDPETYGGLMRDWIHVNHLGNLSMGEYMCACFGLSALTVPPDLEREAGPLTRRMMECVGE